ncbi:MAG: sigma-70 family RNA polymerase sigma factor [Azoarcus sp.]|nr:sigma-70 family RNA polymerase sigma factor [Azoarcus sp.]
MIEGRAEALRERRAGASDEVRRRFFEAEVERLMDRLFGTALRLTRNRADAEDIVAETLAQAWRRIDTMRDRQCFEKWVFRILVNTFISDYRHRRAQPAQDALDSDDELDRFSLFEQVHQPFLLWWGDPERQLLDKFLREDIDHALDALPEAYRLVVVMVEVLGLSYAETAGTLQIPVGTVRSRLNRGRALLQHALWRQARQLGINGAHARGEST